MSSIEPDCVNCVQKETCERAKEGTFCPEFRSTPLPEYDEDTDPNVQWERGEDVTF